MTSAPGPFQPWTLAAAAVGALANAVLLLAVAPLLAGLQRRVTARVQSRRGPPLLQPCLDLLKLLGKEDLEAGEAPAAQRAAPLLALAAALAVGCLVPLGFAAPLGRFADVYLLVGLLVLCSVSTLLAGVSSGSPFGVVGAGREMTVMVALEPLLALALVVAAVNAGSFRMEDALGGAVYRPGLPFSGVLTAAVTLLAFQALVGRVPFDVAEAETELQGGALAEYSGRKLALFRWAEMVKEVGYAALFVGLFVPWGPEPTGLGAVLAFLVFWAKVAVLSVAVALVAATHARYRVDQVLRYYGALLLAGLGAAALATNGL